MMVKRFFYAVVVLLLYLFASGLSYSEGGPNRGPSFVIEPPSLVEFTNDTGTVITCTAQGQPTPTITWTQQDGQPLREVPGARHSRTDGTLYFPPFPGDGFRQGVHDAVYRCAARNAVGTVLSREVHVKAVVLRDYTIRVYNEFVIRGNTAVLRCQVPPFVRDYLTFSWKRGNQPLNTDGRYSVLTTGELYIRGVTQSDNQQSYGCGTRHRFTGGVKESPSNANLFVTEPHGSPRSPQMVHYLPAVSAREGGSFELACAASGFPPPTHTWYREEEGRMLPLTSGRSQVNGGLVLVQFATGADNGRYVCVANNSAGEERAFTMVTVSAPLSVVVHPKRQVSDVGRPAVFNCSVMGHPLRTISWLKDGNPVDGGRDILHIPTVRREDSGMYQCFAYNDFESAQGSAELKLGEGAPVLLSIFQGDSLHPGTSLSMKCSASGNPLPQVTWYLDDSSIPDGPRFRVGDFVTADGHVVSYVNVTNVHSADGGEYSCEATNTVASVRHAARLEVYGPPFIRKMHDVTAVAGRTITVRCPVSGYPIESVVWKKDGVTLPTNHRQRLEGKNLLIIQDIQTLEDGGAYSCEAKGSDNRRAEGKMRMRVIVPPLIEAALMPEQLSSEEGKKTKIMCSVTQGDTPMRISWQKNNNPLPLDEDLNLQSFDDSSLLVFRKTYSRHSGNYTCYVSNAAETANRTTQLIVNVAPRWSIEPSNSFAVVGQAVRMDCAAEGHPVPHVHWKKAEGSQAVDFREVMSSYRRQVFDNGSLSLQEVSEADAGHYLCQANNGIGGGVSKVIQLKIHTPPRFETKFVSHTVGRGKDAELRCEARGDPDIRIQWEKDKQTLDPETLKRLSALEESGPQATLSRLLIRSAGRSDSALYTCIATNKFGQDETNMQLVVQEPPSPPVDLTVRERSSRSVSLAWTSAFSGNSPVTTFIIQYGNGTEHSGDQVLSVMNVPSSDSSAVVRGLVPASPYRFRLLAENALGRSEPGPFVTANTNEEAPGGPPLDVQVHPTGSQSLKVIWKAPREDLLHGVITGYYIGYRPYDSDEPFQYKNVDAASPPPAGGLSYLTNLRRLTRYAVMVQAYNSVGAGPRSDEVEATTLEAAPPTSPVLTLLSMTSSALTITWERPHDDTGLREYILHYKSDGVESWREERVSTGGNSYTLERLLCGTGYRLYMTATNSLGTGEPGDVLVARTKGAAPVSPQRASFVSVNSTFVSLHFGAWSSGGCPILHFSVHKRVQGTWELVSERVDAPQMEIRHLVPNREYTIRVSAHSEAGTTEAEYRFMTLNRTVPVLTSKSGGTFSPGSSLPTYRNLAILLPVVISAVVLLVLVVTVIVCLRKQMDTASTSEDSRKGHSLDHMGLNEFQRKGKEPDTYGAPKSSYYSSPARKPLAMAQGGVPGASSHTIKKYSGWS